MASWPAPLYEIRITFRAPLSFTFRWCTDYTSQDPELLRWAFQRKVVEKGPRRRVFEELEVSPSGWDWSRWVVTLHPPNKWHAEAVGNLRDWSVDYLLTPVGDQRTELWLRLRRRPRGLGRRNPGKARFERVLLTMWKGYGRALERDYRRRTPR